MSAQPAATHEVPTLRTARLVLRALALDDAPALLPALSDADNMRMWSRGPIATVGEVREYIRWNVEGAGVQCWAVTRNEATADALGWVVLIDQKPAVAEIGYILRPDAHGHGFAREAVVAAITHGFRARGLRRIFADTDPDNAPSRRLIEALGFRLEGHLRGEWETHLGVRDSLIYGMLASDSEAP